MPESD
jgi:hypothetical protein